MSSYSLCEELGRGAFGVVYRAWSPIDQAYVAVKKIPLSGAGRRVNKERLESEVALAEKVSHPSIVRNLTHYVEGDSLCIVMELCGGGNLRDLLRRTPGQRLSEEEALGVLSQLVAGVQALHGHGIIHRDLSTANVFVVSQLKERPIVVKIGDFGLSTQLAPKGNVTSFVGNPPFIAPEVAMGRGYREEADVWSLGSILYHALTGHAPYGETRETLRRTVEGRRNAAGEEVFRTLSSDAQDLVNRMLSHHQASRITLQGSPLSQSPQQGWRIDSPR